MIYNNFIFLGKIFTLFVIGLIVLFIIDPLDPSTISTPFLLGIILMGLSLRQNTPLVAVTSVIYSALTVYALVSFHRYHEHEGHITPHPYFWLFQRMGLFLVLCALAIYLAYYRTSTQRILVHFQDILTKLPTPIVISNAVGDIVYVNDVLSSLLKYQKTNIVGKSYIDFFMPDIQEGKAMRYYIEIFEDPSDDFHEIEIKPFESESLMKARFKCLGTGPNRVMVTVLDVVKSR